jgi:hypothetical protein
VTAKDMRNPFLPNAGGAEVTAGPKIGNAQG